jgi:hypothetical protein
MDEICENKRAAERPHLCPRHPGLEKEKPRLKTSAAQISFLWVFEGC